MVVRASKINTIERGDIIKVSFDPILGHEQSGYRPALVISDYTFHMSTGFAFCLPITSKKKDLLFEIDVSGEKISGVALPHGARMLDLQNRDFTFVEKVKIDALEKAKTILTKIINE